MGDVNMTEILNEMVPWIWGQQGMDGKYYRTRKAANLYGTSYLKVIHDKRFINQGGVVVVKEVPQWYIFPAPYATSFEDAPWVIECSVRTVGELEADYGVTVKPEVDLRDFMAPIEEDMPPAPEQTGLVRGIDPNEQPDGSHLPGDTLVQGIPDTYLSTFGRSGLVIQKEMWIRDGTLKDSWDVEDDGMGVPKVVKRRMSQFPGGRQISWANGRLLYDVHNVYRDGEFPYVKFTDISIPDFWYGQGEVDQLIDLQLLLDDTHEIIKQTHIYQAIGKLIVDTDTGLTEDTLSNEPGETMFVRGGTSDRIKWLQGNSPSNELYAYINNLQQSADLVTGSHDVSRGINPTGVTAGKALQSLAAQANIRIRARQIEAQDSLTRLFRLMASRVQQFSPSDLIVGVTGADPNSLKQQKSFRNYALSPADRDATFNINVNAMANSPQSKEAQFNKLLALAQLGFPIGPRDDDRSCGSSAGEEGAARHGHAGRAAEHSTGGSRPSAGPRFRWSSQARGRRGRSRMNKVALIVLAALALMVFVAPSGEAQVGDTRVAITGDYFVSIETTAGDRRADDPVPEEELRHPRRRREHRRLLAGRDLLQLHALRCRGREGIHAGRSGERFDIHHRGQPELVQLSGWRVASGLRQGDRLASDYVGERDD